MRRLRALARDRRGVAAVEFALILPILVAVLILGVDGWLRITHANDMRTALQTGARYYQSGGADDTAAQQAALSAWPTPPTDATLTVSRTCMCGPSAAACSSLCGGSAPPSALITLSARGTFQGLTGTTPLAEDEVVRVR